jgi:hypothetical protein
VSTEPQLIPPVEPKERNWVAIGIGAAVLIFALALLFLPRTGDKQPPVTPVSAPLDPYAASLSVSSLQMSTATNSLGGQLTYIDGRITNSGSRTVTAVTAQTLFHSYSHEIAQNDTQPLKLIRTREPYIDVEPVSAAPIKPGASAEFRLIFDSVAQDWDGNYPEIRLVHIDAK